MSLLFCGWNGFGQVPNHDETLARLTPVPMQDPITSVSCCWSTLCIVTGPHVFVSGFLDGKAGSSKTFTLDNKDIIEQVVNNSNHIVVLSRSKTLWKRLMVSNQSNSQFQTLSLGEMTTEDNQKDFVTKIFSSDNICLALTQLGNLYAVPSRVSDPGFVVIDMACGNEHSVFVTADGSVYTYGQGSRGQLGHDELEAEEKPREIEALAGVRMTRVSCGGWHSAVISEEGDLYTWGWNRFGQLGLKCNTAESKNRLESVYHCEASGRPGTSQEKRETETSLLDATNSDDGSGGVYPSPQLAAWTEKRVISVSCGSRHTVALLEDGSLWGCGWNAYGQLGASSISFPQTASMLRIPLPLDSVGKIQNVVCGGWSTCVLLSE